MAKKKKAPRRGPQPIASWYKNVLIGCGVFAILVAGYCYFTSESDNIPVIVGPNYPKRTPGTVSKQPTYAVYDRLAEAPEHTSKILVARLLPPDEVPEWHTAQEGADATPVSSDTDAGSDAIHSSRVRASSSSAMTSHESSLAKPWAANPSPDRGVDPVPSPVIPPMPKLEKNQVAAKKSSDMVLKPSPSLPVHKGANSQKNTSKPQLRPKIQTPTDRPDGSNKMAPDATKQSVRMQIGSLYSGADSAQALIKRLMQKGGFPGGMRVLTQKAIIQGKAVYRVILVGRCSAQTLAAYQAWLRKQRL